MATLKTLEDYTVDELEKLWDKCGSQRMLAATLKVSYHKLINYLFQKRNPGMCYSHSRKDYRSPAIKKSPMKKVKRKKSTYERRPKSDGVVTTKRKCLRCLKEFNSEGKHNRLCDKCKTYVNGACE